MCISWDENKIKNKKPQRLAFYSSDGKVGSLAGEEAYQSLSTNQVGAFRSREGPCPTPNLFSDSKCLCYWPVDAPFLLLISSGASPVPTPQDSPNFIKYLSGASCAPGAEDTKMTKPWPVAWRCSHRETY